MEYFEIFIEGNKQKLPFVGIKRLHDFSTNVRKKDQNYLFSGTRIDYPRGKTFETLEVLWRGCVRQLENDTLIDESGSFNFVDFSYDWKNLLKQNGLIIVRKASPILLCKNVKPEDVLPIEEYGRYFLPEMEAKGKPLVVFDLINSKLKAIGEKEFQALYKERCYFEEQDASLCVLKEDNYLFLTLSNDQNAIYLVDGELKKGDYYISILSLDEQELCLQQDINAFCNLITIDLGFLGKKFEYNKSIYAYDTVAWIKPEYDCMREEKTALAKDAISGDILNLIPSFIKDELL